MYTPPHLPPARPTNQTLLKSEWETVNDLTDSILSELLHRMTKLIKASGKAYVDLTVSFEGDGEEDLPGPPLRYYFGS